MARRRRRSKVPTLPAAVRKQSTAVVTATPRVTDVVLHLRANRFRDCLELPDRVLRSVASKAANTRLAIRANYGVWKKWCASQKPSRNAYPAEPADLASFLQAQAPPIRVTNAGDFEVLKAKFTAEGNVAKSYATLSRYLGTISKLHIDGGHPDPTHDPEVLAVWRVLRRGLSRPAQKAPLTFEVIRQALGSLPRDLQGKRDRALLLLAYTLMARRSELVALNVDDVAIHEDGSATVTFERLKTGEQSTNYLSPGVMALLKDWLDAAGIRTGAVFRRLDSAGKGQMARMTGQSVGIVFKRISKTLRIPGLDPARISSHSARIGATHDLVEDGAPDAAIMRDAGWKTPRMVAMYSRGAQARRGAMAARLERMSESLGEPAARTTETESGIKN
jgi:integrase